MKEIGGMKRPDSKPAPASRRSSSLSGHFFTEK
jgi:hypothetical protein